MPLERLTPSDLRRYRGHPPYVDFLRELKPGEGGETSTHDEGVTKQTIKKRLSATAESLDMEIKFRRSPADKVVFEVVE